MPRFKCVRCQSITKPEWIFCENCGERLREADVIESLNVKNRISLKKANDHFIKEKRKFDRFEKKKREAFSQLESSRRMFDMENNEKTNKTKSTVIGEKSQQQAESMVKFLENHNKSIHNSLVENERSTFKRPFVIVKKKKKKPDTGYLDCLPSVIDRLNNPEDEDISISTQTDASGMMIQGEESVASNDSQQPSILFWGKQQSEPAPITLDDSLRSMKLFSGTFWGKNTNEETEEVKNYSHVFFPL
jgi:hypothetical protein